MSKPSQLVALRYRRTPALIATAYLSVLIVPWVLTCVLSSRTIRQSRDDSGAVTAETARNLHRVAFSIGVLNFIAALAALPVIYALLARAAVVFSQRTNRSNTLNVRQLFALADRQFLHRSLPRKDRARTSFALAGTVLILLALVLPPVRTILVYTEAKLLPQAFPAGTPAWRLEDYANGWVGSRIGLDPTIYAVNHVSRTLAVEKTRHNLINTFPAEWKAAAWYEPDGEDSGHYFASSLPRNTTTGMYRQHALRMNSTSSCNTIPVTEFPAPCPGNRDQVFEASYENANLTVKVCVPGAATATRGPWNSTENRQDLTETIYISVFADRLRYTTGNYTLRCTGQTSMGYFELGNSFNSGKFGPLLSSFEFPTSGAETGDFTDEEREIPIFLPYSELTEKDYGTETYDGSFMAPGPLAVTARALFGAESFFDLAQSITEPDETLSRVLCRLSPIPFQRVFRRLRRCNPQNAKDEGPFSGSYSGWANDRVNELVYQILRTAPTSDSVLNTGMYHANKATLEAAVGDGLRAPDPPNQIWRAEGIEVRTPVVSTAALVVVSVFLGLQVVGVLALVGYIYSVPTWTGTLDAMAVAGVAMQLAERDEGFLRSDGLCKPTEEQSCRMESQDALVGAVESSRREGVADKASPSTVSEVTARYVLSIGGPGLISRRLMRASKTSV